MDYRADCDIPGHDEGYEHAAGEHVGAVQLPVLIPHPVVDVHGSWDWEFGKSSHICSIYEIL